MVLCADGLWCFHHFKFIEVIFDHLFSYPENTTSSFLHAILRP